jgi:hypothetical protein
MPSPALDPNYPHQFGQPYLGILIPLAPNLIVRRVSFPFNVLALLFETQTNLSRTLLSEII